VGQIKHKNLLKTHKCNLPIISVFSKNNNIVRAFSVCPSVWAATTFQGVGRSCLFVAPSITYDPRTRTTEVIFFGPVLDPMGGVQSQNFIFFHIKMGLMSLMMIWIGRGIGSGFVHYLGVETRSSFVYFLGVFDLHLYPVIKPLTQKSLPLE
jgi:hypothetical protein